MKKLLLAVLFLHTVFACEAIWNNGPTQLLRDIFAITKTEGVDDLSTATKQSNFRWIRPKGLERWHLYSILDDSQRAKLTQLIKHSAIAKTILPTKKHYDAIVILGATTSRVKDRIEFLMKIIVKQGITCDKIYLLGSTRDLTIGTESDQKLAIVLKAANTDATEMMMMQYLWDKTNKPKSLVALPVIAIQSGERHDGTRANTNDTLVDMVKTVNLTNRANILFISNNPYVCYQDAVIKYVLKPYPIAIETVGSAMKNESMEIVLDTVARCLTNISFYFG